MWKLLVIFCMCTADEYYNNLGSLLNIARTSADVQEPNYEFTHFNALQNYQVNAVPVSESDYPWTARVVHSRASDIPHVCTAVCIAARIFITASRCLYSLKLTYTRIHYHSHRIPVLTFVVPSDASKQSFDDIGFIVVEAVAVRWHAIKLFNVVNRTDNDFHWFERSYGQIDCKVVGYAKPKLTHKNPNSHYRLSKLTVVSNIHICAIIMTRFKRIPGFRIPCYHSCNVKQFKDHINESRPVVSQCTNYLGVEGGAVVDVKTNKLIGVATWGALFNKYELPVGYAVPNSRSFFDDFTCAMRIRDDNELIVTKGHYQSLCH